MLKMENKLEKESAVAAYSARSEGPVRWLRAEVKPHDLSLISEIHTVEGENQPV